MQAFLCNDCATTYESNIDPDEAMCPFCDSLDVVPVEGLAPGDREEIGA